MKNHKYKIMIQGLTWWSSGLDSMLPLQESWVCSLVRELSSHMLCVMAKKKKKKRRKNNLKKKMMIQNNF